MPKKRKHVDFVRNVQFRKGKREVRDDVFRDIVNTSYVEQREKLRNWIYEQIQESKAFCDGLEPCTIGGS